jgi:hypothetical protein
MLWLKLRYHRISDVIREVSHNRCRYNRARRYIYMYMSLSFEQNAGQYHKIKTGNTSFGSVESFKYFGTTYQIETAFKRVKVKVPRNRPEGPEGGGGCRGIALLFLDLGARREWVVSTTPRPLYPRERPCTHCTGGWVGSRAGLDVCEKFRPPTGIRSLDRPARRQSLYRLNYPGPHSRECKYKNI